MVGFSYNGTMGNEFSSKNNPWGIMNKAEYSIFLDLANVLKITSSSETVTKEQLQSGLVQINHKLQILIAGRTNLNAMPYDLGRKIEIDNLSLQINPMQSQYTKLCQFLEYFFHDYEIRCKAQAEQDAYYGKKPKKTRLTYSKIVKEWVNQLYLTGRHGDKGEKVKAKNAYDYIVNRIGTGSSAMSVSNKHI